MAQDVRHAGMLGVLGPENLLRQFLPVVAISAGSLQQGQWAAIMPQAHRFPELAGLLAGDIQHDRNRPRDTAGRGVWQRAWRAGRPAP